MEVQRLMMEYLEFLKEFGTKFKEVENAVVAKFGMKDPQLDELLRPPTFVEWHRTAVIDSAGYHLDRVAACLESYEYGRMAEALEGLKVATEDLTT